MRSLEMLFLVRSESIHDDSLLEPEISLWRLINIVMTIFALVGNLRGGTSSEFAERVNDFSLRDPNFRARVRLPAIPIGSKQKWLKRAGHGTDNVSN